ncbi:MAG: bifunctional (p)ppGpp synthetase/guanosine-3',5'-bis(diphosphate) 3'-pyrophosphohydrolase [Chloroflexi bacterium]|nr:MAG: bifunctional (p)ppGpp synthetase/guanosine-3',5'-bis(diphosphate) 3'-pyrophosphohydrolase [Chloroflexota bacterium]
MKLLPHGANGESAARIRYAYTFIEKAHGDHRCETGLLHIEHNLAVAHILVKLGTDVSTVTAGMLHDVLEPHTDVTETAVLEAFDSEVVEFVHTLKDLYAYSLNEQYLLSQSPDVTPKQLEEIRGAILSISKGDIRVLLILLADILQNLRNASTLPEDRQRAIASEGMNIYAPLANRLGIWQLKWELEDLSFRFLQPIKYKEIASKLAVKRVERDKKIKKAVIQLSRKIKQSGIKASISGRPKHIYSIFRKMKRKDLDFEHIYDIQALRVILEPNNASQESGKSNKQVMEDERSLCYQVLGLVHGLWQPIPREFDDYIAAPKANGYKSLHTAVIDPATGQTLEVQIRTLRMHEEAEKGVAAHWAYKEEGGERLSASIQRRIQSLRELLSVIQRDDKPDAEDELLETGALERIYVFTPKGKVVDLPAGATPIDFAYQIHTEVGHRCRGARVNGKMISLDYELQSGERVEIITGNRPGPSRDWMNPSLGYTTSARTRSKIRQWFRTQEREQNIAQGRDVVDREIKRLGLIDTHTVADIAEALKFDDEDEFLAKVGFGDIQSAQITGAITRLHDSLKPDDELRPLILQNRPRSKGLTVRGVSGLHTRLAKCCNPIPPEPIIGYITRGQGVTVHRQNCNEVRIISEKENERLIDVSWGDEAETYPIPIAVEAYRRPRIVDDVQNLLRGRQIHTPKTKTISTEDGMTAIYLVVEVDSLAQLNWLLNKLENLPNVTSAKRQRWT